MSNPGCLILVIPLASLSLVLSYEANRFAAGSRESCDGNFVNCNSDSALSGSVLLQAKSAGKIGEEQPTAGRSLMKALNKSAWAQSEEPPTTGRSLRKALSLSAWEQASAAVSATSGAVCYFADCGCPPFRKSSCTEAHRESATSWCGQSKSNCETCNAIWCDGQAATASMPAATANVSASANGQAPAIPVLSTTSSGICYFAEFGCPPFQKASCSEGCSFSAKTWCGQSKSNCETCNAVWCDGQAAPAVMPAVTADASASANGQAPAIPVLSTSSSGICYFADCGCPPFRKSSCTEASRESATSWCGQSKSNCKTCNAVWCDGRVATAAMPAATVNASASANGQAPAIPVLSTTSSGVCYFADCGCPPFRKSSCSEAHRESATSWCGLSKSNCETCNAVWCDGQAALAVMPADTVNASSPTKVQTPEITVLSASSSGICYFADCGCPPFRTSSCTEASRESATSWCGQGKSNCETCNAVWCDGQAAPAVMPAATVNASASANGQAPVIPVLSTTSSGVCYFADCGCPPFRKSSCTEASRESATSWCGQSKSNCETCNAVWCDGQAAPAVMPAVTVNASASANGQAPEIPVLSTTSSGVCYFSESHSCTGGGRVSASSWCGQSKKHCETCNAVWC